MRSFFCWQMFFCAAKCPKRWTARQPGVDCRGQLFGLPDQALVALQHARRSPRRRGTVMALLSSNDFESVPPDSDTRSTGRFARCVDFLAGPLAMGASGLTFFLAYTLTVPPADDLLGSVKPALIVAAAEPGAAPVTMPATGLSEVLRPVPAKTSAPPFQPPIDRGARR